ncbi:TRAP transporter small permease [Gemmobacter sp. LW-1]|uniref:TRAP transporter small permease n=1 Tax=Gemmobacter sp. LW-1 TaxID=1529005 RepID=UPI0006C751CA|nr:TRAP transporter small permease [Gemmobacter sp. LW-1]
MGAFTRLLNGLGAFNAALLWLGRVLGATAMGLMVLIILAQVFFRYVLGNALAWPEEAARFLMLWATGLMIPTAYRRGGFVSVEMLVSFLPRIVGRLLGLVLLALVLVVLVAGFRIGLSEVTGFGGRFATDSLKVPASLALDTWVKVPKSWMMASLVTGLAMLILVNVELMLRGLAELTGQHHGLVAIADAADLRAE